MPVCNKLTTRTHGQGVSACLRCMRIINNMVADLVYIMDGFMENGSGLVPSTVYPKPQQAATTSAPPPGLFHLLILLGSFDSNT